ncbi:amidohydrolase family protein [Salinirubrum litoreum]|uniref:Amidohydrolase family protein n=1 Tax=Salinirubrum litoreum TaxID=1126234 RepID=A0ABD5RGR0_9EURY|nr:amidohydrolase family protein [Salinirubrum litoreum]
MPTYDLLIRNAYLRGRDAVVDVGVEGGQITAVGRSLAGESAEVVDAGGNLLAPGFADAHKHVDRALAATGERRPIANERPNESPEYLGDLFDADYRDLSVADLTDRIAENLRMAVVAGTTHVRSHVTVDTAVGIDTMTAVLRAADRLDCALDLQVVPYAAGDEDADTAALVSEAIDRARDRLDGQVLLGGSIGLLGGRPPRNVDATIGRWFDTATSHGVDLDVHVTSRGAAGYYVLDRLAEATRDHGYEGRVTVVHAWALAHLPDWWLDGLLDRLAGAGIGVTVCYNSLRQSMPIDRIDRSLRLAHGTDNDQDFVYPHGNADPIEAAQIASYVLIGDWHFDRDYRWSETNPALDLLWRTITHGSAETMGIDGYGIEVGTPADLVLLDEPSPEWAIVRRASRRKVWKAGRLVAENGTFVG